MDSRGVRRSRREEEEESYFISMADMMVGLLFIFIILLLYFALQFRHTTDALTGADKTRKEILETLEEKLNLRFKPYNLKVTINTETGVLSLPDKILFGTGQYILSPQGREAVSIVAQELAHVLPCYTDMASDVSKPDNCPIAQHKIDAIFVEGHTDSVPLARSGLLADNLDLSTLRATNTFRQIVKTAPELNMLMNASGKRPVPILSVSGYGDQRPVDDVTGTPEEVNARNRRIDLRFLMITPHSDTGDEISKRIAGGV